MARKSKARELSPSPSESDESASNETLTDPPSSINPYKILSIEKTANTDQIKSAYRKAALKHHPDKAAEENKSEANKKFQEIAFAYAILSDEKRRRRYDATGNTAESLDLEDDDFNWMDFFREQKKAMVDGELIDKIKKEYQRSEEEKQDVLRVYTEYEGDMDAIYEEIMCSNVLDDDERFRGYIDEAIKTNQVENFPTYAKETKKKRRERIANARGEAEEAMQLAQELGVKDKLFGKKGSKKSGDDEDSLKALIQQRQQSRSMNFLENLEAKYGGGAKKSKNKRKVEEPPEELFRNNAKKSRERK